jgi:MFS family permease
VKNKAALVMTAGALAYLVAVINRSSLGVAALAATERFDVAATMLSTLAVSQLAVYAAMQIPVGILLDRFGARRLLVFGACSMAVGQLLVAFIPLFGFAVAGRMLVGLGDAFVFISMIRLVHGWFDGAMATRIQQLLTNVGQVGQAISALPFALVLHLNGWTVAFASLAFVTVALVFVLLAVVQEDRNPSDGIIRAESLKTSFRQLASNVAKPGVRASFWIHFTLQSAPSVFLLLWGYPFLVSAENFSPSAASFALSTFAVTGLFSGPVIGWLCGRYPGARIFMVIGTALSIGGSWILVLLQPESAPTWMILLLIFVLGVSGPMSMVAFDFVRNHVSKSQLGAVNGFVNVGGFVATFSMMFIAGVILDQVALASSDDTGVVSRFTLEGFRSAMSIEFFALALGVLMFAIELAKTRALKSHQGNKQ